MDKDNIQSVFDEYFTKEADNIKETFNQLSLAIYALDSDTKDLYHLAKLLPDEHLYKVVSYFNGAVVKFPTKEKFKESLILAFIYYFHEIKKLPWSTIKEILHLNSDFQEYHPISLGKKVNKIKEKINKHLAEILNKVELNTVIDELKKEYEQNNG
jgi:hypothetical protein